mgnify:CR=1 FL=1
MKKWKSYHTEISRQCYDAIVIGSGIGGLCTAALLGLKGERVLILEKHFKIGGWTHTFRRKEYEWDVGIHYIGQVHKEKSSIRKLFDLISNSKLEWSSMDDNYDRIIFPDKSYDFTAPREKFIDDMISYFPKEELAILKYMNLLDEVARASKNYFSQKALSGIIGSITYPFMTRNFFKYSDTTTLEVLSGLTNDPKLIGVLTGQWGDYGLPPAQSSFAMHALVARHYLDGGNYPTGTSRRIAETISNLIEENNGVLAVNAPVKNIKIHNGNAVGVEMENGDLIEAKNIISNAGVVNTNLKLLKNSNVLTHSLNNNIKNIQQTKSYVCLHIGLNASAAQLGLKDTNLWIYPGYDHDEMVQNYISDQKADFPVLYVSFPSVKDNQWEEHHPMSSTMEVITLARWRWYQDWEKLAWKKRGHEYENKKEKLIEKMLEVVFKQVGGIKDFIDHKELSTPLTVKDLANYQRGEMYGIDHSPSRFRQDWLRPKSHINGLFYTGQDITTVGVSSALFSGLITASAVLKEDLSKLLTD